jgi:hypothetical protein
VRESPPVRFALLIILAAVPAGIEAAMIRRSELDTTISLAPHISALRPFGTFHDLLWVMVYHRTWAEFVGESVAAIGVRALLTTGLIALAWPVGRQRPSLNRLVVRNLVFAAVTGAILAPWAALGVVASEVSVFWYAAAELVPLLIMAPLLQRGGIVVGWWRGLPPLRIVILSLVNIVTLTAGSALQWWAPPILDVPVALLVGGANGILWWFAVRAALAPGRVRLPRVPVTPIVVAVVMFTVFALADATLLGGHHRERREPRPLAQLEALSPDHPVIFLAGYDSDYRGEASGRTLPVVRYSYQGIDSAGHPRPYSPVATHQSLVESARQLARQVDEVHRRTGRPVGLLAESEGALVTRVYLQTMPHPAVDRVAYVSPPIRAGRAYYPPRGQDSGWGVGLGWELRAIFAVLSAVNMLPNSADEPFIRSLIDDAPLFRGRLVCPERGVAVLAFLPVSDAITASPSIRPQVPVVEVPGLHGLLIDRPDVRRRLAAFFSQGRMDQHRVWGYAALQWAGAAWLAPLLPVGWNPAWRTVAGKSTRHLRSDKCAPL